MSRPWMPLYIGDYRGDTAHLTAAEHGAYLLLIMHYWDRGALPDDDGRLARIAACSVEEWSAIRPNIQAFFHDGWRHKRIEEERAKSEERAKAGRRGGRPPKAKQKQNESKPQSKTEAPQPHPEEEREGDARAREAEPPKPQTGSLISPGAHRLADECLLSIGINPANEASAPPELCGLRYQAEIWHTRGHDPPTVVAAFARQAKRGKPLNYIAKAVETAVAERAMPTERTNERRNDGARTDSNGFRVALGQLDAAIQAAESLDGGVFEGGQDVVGLLSDRRCA